MYLQIHIVLAIVVLDNGRQIRASKRVNSWHLSGSGYGAHLSETFCSFLTPDLLSQNKRAPAPAPELYSEKSSSSSGYRAPIEQYDCSDSRLRALFEKKAAPTQAEQFLLFSLIYIIACMCISLIYINSIIYIAEQCIFIG